MQKEKERIAELEAENSARMTESTSEKPVWRNKTSPAVFRMRYPKYPGLLLSDGIDEEHSTLAVYSFTYSFTKKQGLIVIDVFRQKCPFSRSTCPSHQAECPLKTALRVVRLSPSTLIAICSNGCSNADDFERKLMIGSDQSSRS